MRAIQHKPAYRRLLTVACLAAAAPCIALADPCRAIPDRGPAPSYLATASAFGGPVVYVGDGDSLCVELSRGPEGWVEVRLQDFNAPELSEPGGRAAKAMLTRLAMGRVVSCVAGRQSYDRLVAACTLNGRPIGELMQEAGVRKGGRGTQAK